MGQNLPFFPLVCFEYLLIHLELKQLQAQRGEQRRSMLLLYLMCRLRLLWKGVLITLLTTMRIIGINKRKLRSVARVSAGKCGRERLTLLLVTCNGGQCSMLFLVHSVCVTFVLWFLLPCSLPIGSCLAVSASLAARPEVPPLEPVRFSDRGV